MRIHRNEARQTWEVWLELCPVASFSQEWQAEAFVKAEKARRSVIVEESA